MPGTVAVASNMCHKFPKALVGALKRFRYGRWTSRWAGHRRLGRGGRAVRHRHPAAYPGTLGAGRFGLYVSLAFVAVLFSVGGYVLHDACAATGATATAAERPLWPAVSRPSICRPCLPSGARVCASPSGSPCRGFATGMLAATIAVGGFIGVPGLIYVLGVPA